ncbi:hypothetical protein [Leptospira santarosai]|uniref:Uncharacterized protein n=2 Tax=Leptospira santarosai TaxID=28183 RepID=K8XYN2_9LEPT|nr:hypothetical protein [Leptospira santarosai]ASV10605.1 hypothetical protein B2G51_01065 [Leptospira santarosai]EKS07300.1 hypothetical protein LEP1GSC071_0301 [Leptospira santarosai str. JET]EKT86434.1 hypothetical protein LSS_12032 [Leptospira santarosai serovar Shermani str. LT 821]EMN21161.1 hypothetical protein LEP1GSC063_1214 [Leptospira santarosai serovar Arenal str. MAVJ 401]EPG83577.1 hypothetical protein LEP1GSC048_1158 [Leptospira santarosai serovar Shermani str. 1342KT]
MFFSKGCLKIVQCRNYYFVLRTYRTVKTDFLLKFLDKFQGNNHWSVRLYRIEIRSNSAIVV